MVIINTSAVATIIQAVSALLISDVAAKAGVASVTIAADVIGAARSAARNGWAPMTFPGKLWSLIDRRSASLAPAFSS
jgi:hypothetical protein